MLPFLRRHPFVSSLLILLLLVVGGGGYFLAGFDLNDYRSDLEGRLSTALRRQVRLGELRFALGRGVELEVRNAAIGNEGDDFTLKVDFMEMRLRLIPLLRRELNIATLNVDRPTIDLRLGRQTSETEGAVEVSRKLQEVVDLLRRIRIDSLSVREATCRVADSRFGRERSWGAEGVTFKVADLAASGPVKIAATGTIVADGGRTPWEFDGKVDFPADDGVEDGVALEFDVTAQSISPATVAAVVPQAQTARWGLVGASDLKLYGRGNTRSGVDLSLKLRGEESALRLADFYAAPRKLREISVSTVWQAQGGGRHRFSRIVLQLDDLHATGEVVWSREAQHLQADLTLAAPLPVVSRHFPDRLAPKLATILRDGEPSGTVALEHFRLNWALPEEPATSGTVRLTQGRLTLPRVGVVEDVDVELGWQGGRLEVKGAQGRLLGGRVTVRGGASLSRDGTIDLRADGVVRSELLGPFLPEVVRQRVRLTGPLGLTATFGGTLDRLLGDLTVKLTDVAIAVDDSSIKTASQPAELLMLTTTTRQEWIVNQGKLSLPFGILRVNGAFAKGESGSYHLSGEAAQLVLEGIPPLVELQRSLNARGEVDLTFAIDGDRSGLLLFSGNGEVRKLGLHLWGAVADLRGGEGNFSFDRNGVTVESLSGLLGYSPLRASGRLAWSPGFLLDLAVDLPRARATDLIFRSPKLALEGVRGGLLIDTSGIQFRQLEAKLGDKTAVTVNGTLRDYHAPKVALRILAPRASIGEIVALWSGERSGAPSRSAGPEVEVSAQIVEGDLYGVRIHHADGRIAYRDGALTIQPMKLGIGAGRGTLSIVTGRLGDEHPSLKVEGSVEEVDADAIYRQILKQKGVVTGRLSGDFTLSGELGRYLPTSEGAVKFRIVDGSLRGFKTLGRVFSLLNLSNLLTLNLSALDADGFPYERISGTLAIKDGVVRSEDLVIDSPALDMALVGQHDLVNDRLDLVLAAKPLRIVDKVLSSIPLAGWILTGEKKSLVTAQFRITGSAQSPDVDAIPVSSLSEMVIGIFKRTLGLPAKLVQDIGAAAAGDGAGAK